MTKVIKEEFKKLEPLKISDDSLTCNTSLEIFYKEFNRMSRMDEDLFTYEVEIPRLASITCDLNKEDDLEQQMTHGSDVDMEYDPSNVEFTEWIDTNVLDFKTPTCKTFKEFNYLLQIDPDVLTNDIDGFKTYEEYKDDWIYEWNKDIPWVHEKPWTNNGVWEEPTPLEHYCKPFSFKSGHSKWPTYWYEALEDGKLKDEALKNKAIMEGIIDEDDESHNEGWRRWDGYENTIHDHEERENEKEHGNEERCELFDNPHQETPVYKIRFEMIKYSFGQDEELAKRSNISTEPSELVFEPVVNESNIEVQPKVWSDAPIIEEYESDSDDECVSVQTKGLDTPSFANKQVKTPKEIVKNQSTHSQKPKGSRGNTAMPELHNKNGLCCRGREQTLIEAARTMHGRFIFYQPFGAEAVKLLVCFKQGILKKKMNLLKTALNCQYGIPILPQTHLLQNQIIRDEAGRPLISTASPNEGLSISDITNSQEDDSEIPPLEDIHQDTTDGIFTHSSYDDEFRGILNIASVKTASTPIETQKPLDKDEMPVMLMSISKIGGLCWIKSYWQIHNMRLSISMTGGLNTCNCKKQTIMATSTIEAKYVAV
ncbi:hypothetical protein Tco_0704388 [Tanacetum coccineum]|uniref:Uncharacterized protein n=1 Tax=Tanacetum coccineum TaxID=301880 RepID=A0ABQ4Y3F8_9ASTR